MTWVVIIQLKGFFNSFSNEENILYVPPSPTLRVPGSPSPRLPNALRHGPDRLVLTPPVLV
jgi:hypothetical protein